MSNIKYKQRIIFGLHAFLSSLIAHISGQPILQT